MDKTSLFLRFLLCLDQIKWLILPEIDKSLYEVPLQCYKLDILCGHIYHHYFQYSWCLYGSYRSTHSITILINLFKLTSMINSTHPIRTDINCQVASFPFLKLSLFRLELIFIISMSSSLNSSV